MKITILGSGSAYGVPFAGGHWGNCDPNNPKNRRTTPSILIEEAGSTLLIDMGPDYKEQSIRHEIREIDGVFFTHPHADHIMGMYNLPIMMKYFENKNLPLYADRFTRKEIEKNFWYMFDPKINVEYSGPGRPYLCEVIPYSPFKVGNMEVLPFIQDHGHMKSVGVRVGNFAYSTDTCGFPSETWDALKELDVWIVDCNCEESTDSSHSNLKQSLGWIEELNPTKAFLHHLDYTMDFDTISAKLPENVELTYDGLVIEI
jgi:phosphoribosyl 1,2-cyclic phosphate phosphodiesterase